jgi:UDP-GlcNAc:undecaprenyl-phosphate GlcNAc-1-phosphate transferase
VDGVAAFLIPLGIALVCTPLAARLATTIGLVDRPGPLKAQARPVPYLGGLAVGVALGIGLVAEDARLLVPLALALALGIVDDARDLPPRVRVAAEVAIAATAAWSAPGPGRLGPLVTALLVLGLLNAINLIDGLDGLAGGVACASALGFAALGGAVRDPALVLAGGLVGFLVWNRPPARVYLGDGGAYLVGTALGLLSALALDSEGTPAAWPAVGLLVSIPVLDTAVAILRRVRAGRPVFSGDRSHVYDQLVERGWAPLAVLAAMVGAQGALAAVAVAAASTSGLVAWSIAGAVVLLALAVAFFGGFVAETNRRHT